MTQRTGFQRSGARAPSYFMIPPSVPKTLDKQRSEKTLEVLGIGKMSALLPKSEFAIPQNSRCVRGRSALKCARELTPNFAHSCVRPGTATVKKSTIHVDVKQHNCKGRWSG